MREIKKAAALIPAAGLSSRMDRLKPLMPLGSASVIQSAAGCFIQAGITEIIVVLGYKAEEIIPDLEPLNVRIVINSEYEQGMYSSIQKGVRALSPEAEAFFVLPGDYPLVRPETIKKIYAAYERSTLGIAHPVYRRHRGHPPLISGNYKEFILSSREEEGLKSFLRIHDGDSLEVQVDDSGILADLDTPAEYQEVLQKRGKPELPDRESCLTILNYYGVPQSEANRSLAAARLAEKLTGLLQERGHLLDLELVCAAALLCNPGNGLADHAQVGAKRAKALGMGEIAAIIEVQMNFLYAAGEKISEAAIVYLAHKLTGGERTAPLRERLRSDSAVNIFNEIAAQTGHRLSSDDFAGCLCEPYR